MKTFLITYTAHVTGCVEVDAETYDDAFDKARDVAERDAPINDHLELDYQPTEGEE